MPRDPSLPAMKETTVYLVRLPEPARDAARRAVEESLPEARVVAVRSVAELRRADVRARELLVLSSEDEAEVVRASQGLDEHELPRWAIVCLGRIESDLAETVAPEDWNPRMLGRIFRLVLLQHELWRENLQLRGDLKTVARRVSHDLRTPLSCIHTVCELLREQGSDPAGLQQTSGIIRNAALEAGQVIDRVGALLKASTDPLPAAPLSAGVALASALEQLEAELRASGRPLRQPATWPEVLAVRPWLEVVWYNLLHNALRHGERAGAIEIGWVQQESATRFWIASDGVVPDPMRPRLLRPFHGLHAHTAAGMGLSIVERLVALQGGRCGYDAGEDGRATFWFTLPLPTAPRPRRIARAKATAAR